jgi:sugar transferase (PEP-CTERM/EpsH1 system associated)
MDLLFLAQRIPYPPTKGEKIRSWPILRHLCARHRVHLGCLVDDPADWPHVDTVRALCADAHVARLDRRRARVACLRGLLTGEALSVTFYRDAGLDAWVARVLREVRPDVVFVSSSNMAPYVLDRPGGRLRVVDLVDVDSEKWRAYAERGGPPMRWVHAREWRRVAALEGRIARECDDCTFVSEDEAALFARLFPVRTARVHAIANGVDHRFFDPAPGFASPFAAEAGAAYVFTGTMDYPPNIDAAVWFAREMLPGLRAARPDARFYVVGSNPAVEVQALARLAGVEVTGRVADVRPYLAHATACVAPMRVARGIQNKVLEAMAMARPVVVTQGALTGIDAVPGEELLLADTPAAFVQACLQAATPHGHALGAAARARVLRDYAWEERLKRFDSLLARAEAPISAA